MFCPECGNPLTDGARNQSAAAITSKLGAESSVTSREDNRVPAKVPAENPGPPVASHTAREKTRETLQRASSAARGAIEDTGKRVEKIHHVSSVMLEEATYDPSLRFVLVALGLFVIFVVLLVLSKVMG
jgi:hypothetical protein